MHRLHRVHSPTRGVLACASLVIASVLVVAALATLWRRATSPLLQVWQKKDTAADDLSAVHALAFSPDSQLLAVGDLPDPRRGDPEWLRGIIQLRRVQDGTVVRTWKTRWSVTWGGVAFSPDGTMLYSSDGFCIDVWRVGDGKLVDSWPSPDGPTLTALFRRKTAATIVTMPVRVVSPDGRIEARSTQWPGGVELRRVADGRVMGRRSLSPVDVPPEWARLAGLALPGLDYSVYVLCFAPDGKSLAASDASGRLTLFRVRAR